ncbi:MAG: hypothetical protein N2316_00660 [Spirochaetes bacterium]|nr:hypothetical protein [Spirochaetota bacterium]
MANRIIGTHMCSFLLMGILVCFVVQCKDESRFVEPNYVLQKWARAIQQLNYREYASCEAYPKEEAVFREMYREYYLAEIMTTEVDEISQSKELKDHEGNRYLRRTLEFEATIVKRNTGKPDGIVRGNADFIRYLEGKRAKDGWLLSNRTIIFVPR